MGCVCSCMCFGGTENEKHNSAEQKKVVCCKISLLFADIHYLPKWMVFSGKYSLIKISHETLQNINIIREKQQMEKPTLFEQY